MSGMGRGRPRKTDPDAVLDTAMKLFWERGYEATSMNDLAAATGMAKPGLYATFGDKETLYAKALARYVAKGSPEFQEIFNAPVSLEIFLRRYLDTVAASLLDTSTPCGCFIVNSMIDCASQSAALEALGREVNKKRNDAMVKRFRAARKQGELPADADVRALADFFSGQTLAMAVMGRAGADRKRLQAFIEVVMTALPRGALSSQPGSDPV